jgi:hypothetical protein
MSNTDQSSLSAKDAILSASYAETEGERQGLVDLARAWTQGSIDRAKRSSRHDHRCIRVAPMSRLVIMRRWSKPEIALAAVALVKLGLALHLVFGLFAI